MNNHKGMTNNEFKLRVMARFARTLDIPIKYLTTRQASKFRAKKGTFYKLWKAEGGRV